MNSLTTRNVLQWIFTFLITMILIGCSIGNGDNNSLNGSSNDEQFKEESIENNSIEESLVDLNQEKIKKLEQIEKAKEEEKVEQERKREEAVKAEEEKKREEAEKAKKEKEKREAEEVEEEKKRVEAKKAKEEQNKKEAEKAKKEKQKKEAEKAKKKQKKKEEESSKEKASSKPKPKSNNSFANRVIELTNNERKKAGLKPLKKHNQLMKSAQAYSVDMYERGRMDHNGSKKYGDFPGVINAYVSSYRSIAENIAQGHPTPEAVVDGWMNSTGHRGNILNENFTHTGVGYVSTENYWTQHFLME